MRTYPAKKKRARKKQLSRKETSRKREKPKKRRVAAKREPKKAKKRSAKRTSTKKRAAKTRAKKAGAKRTRAKAAAKKRGSKRATRQGSRSGRKKTASGRSRKKTASGRKKPARSAAQKTPARKRGVKNARVAAKVEKAEELREKSRRKKLTPAQRRALKAKAAEEREAAEASRLFEERLRQIREEEQTRAASKKNILEKLQKQFRSLINEAIQTDQLPRVPREKTIDSDRFKGKKRAISIRQVLTEELVVDIMHRVEQVAAKLPAVRGYGWLGVINFASLGESLMGYGQVILRSTLPGASMFQVQAIESTGIQNTREGMLMKLEEKLDSLAGEKSATVFVNFITVQCYGRRGT